MAEREPKTSENPTTNESQNAESPSRPTVRVPAASSVPEFMDLYPCRKNEGYKMVPSLVDKMKGVNPDFIEEDCAKGVIQAVKESPLVKLLIGALQSHGCEFDLVKHVSCEPCSPNIYNEKQSVGTFDERYNQIVVCSNYHKDTTTHGHLLRSLISMYDACARKIDYTNVDHLACTEIRKANLGKCNIGNWLANSSGISLDQMHINCVMIEATDSLVRTKFVPQKVAEEAVQRTIFKCYNDLEPVGRRCWNRKDMNMAYKERYLYGYD